MYTPLILCGGSGTRLWPLSRTAYPKQLIKLMSDKTLLQQTLLRLSRISDIGSPIIICNQKYRFIVAEQLREIGVNDAQIILETEGKNTAPAVTLAALALDQKGQNPLLLVLPADHVIQDELAFCEAVKAATPVAQEGILVTFGVSPTKAETGYGYIKKGKPRHGTSFEVEQFVEKPSALLAKEYLDSGAYLWNSGIFLFHSKSYLNEMEKYAPDILASCRSCIAEMQVDLDFHRISPERFSQCRSESIDYAIMEKSQKIAVVPLHSGWSDLGSWTSLCEVHPADENGNILKGDVVTNKVTNSYLRSESRLVAAVGVSDLVIVETADAVLVAHKDKCQEVKQLVSLLKQDRRTEVDCQRKHHHPWGYYDILTSSPDYQTKRLVIKPGVTLSLQSHQYRSEHWIIVKGRASVTCGDKHFELHENESTCIPAGVKHRLENAGDTPLELIEIQTGSYLGEDDIVRFEILT